MKWIILRTSSILVAEIWKPPDVAESNRDRDTREQKIEFVRKCSPLCVVVLIDKRFWQISTSCAEHQITLTAISLNISKVLPLINDQWSVIISTVVSLINNYLYSVLFDRWPLLKWFFDRWLPLQWSQPQDGRSLAGCLLAGLGPLWPVSVIM